MKIRYNREIISGAIFVVLSAVLWFLIPVQVQTLEKTPNQRTDLPPYRHWWYVPLLCRSAAGGDLRPGEAGVVCDEREFSLQCL